MLSLLCDICLEKYGDNERSPKILSCGHTFCSESININKNKIICPIDREKYETSFDKIPLNRIILDLISEEKKQTKIVRNFQKYDISLNIGMIGNSNVGKTSLSACYEKN